MLIVAKAKKFERRLLKLLISHCY